MNFSVVLFALWFFVPGAIANATPVLAAILFKKWDWPMDFGYKFRGKQLFGPNKTWRGLISGVLAACIISAIQYYVWLPSAFAFESLTFMVVLGGLIGLGALLGDAIESFFKRQIGREAGQSWFPFDQVDYIIGGLLFSLFLVTLVWEVYV